MTGLAPDKTLQYRMPPFAGADEILAIGERVVDRTQCASGLPLGIPGVGLGAISSGGFSGGTWVSVGRLAQG